MKHAERSCYDWAAVVVWVVVAIWAMVVIAACFFWPGNVQGATSLRLEWTATGDDGDVGTVDHYVLHWSTDSVAVAAGAGDTLVMSGPWHEAGTSEVWTGVIDFPVQTTIYAAIVAVDDVGLHGPVSNVVSRYIDDDRPPGAVFGLRWAD